MNYYDNEESWRKRGIDWDLHACLQYNPQDGFMVADIAMVLAVVEGENDERDWRWVLELIDGRIVYLQGWCDYTGWDCQSDAFHKLADTPRAAAEFALPENIYDWKESEVRAAQESLIKQLEEGKAKTWREEKDEEFGLTGDKDIT